MDRNTFLNKELELEKDREKILCQDSLRVFCQRSWKIIEPVRQYHHNWHIDAICDHLEAVSRREIKKLIINIPPRHMKSLIVSVMWPAWVWGPYNEPWHDFICGSYHPSLSSRDAVKSRRIIQSEWYKRNWGDRVEIAPDKNQILEFQNLKGGTRNSVSVGGVGTGKDADTLIADDPHNIKGIDSQKKRDAVFDWWDNAMASRGNDLDNFAKVIIMQRAHENDLVGHLKDKGGYEELVLPFRYDPTIYSYAKESPLPNKDPRTKEGELLWASRFSEEGAQELEGSLTAYQKTGQLEQRPTPREGATFKRKWFTKRWKIMPDKFEMIIDSWDLTMGGTTGVSKDNGYKIGKLGPYYYIIEEINEKMDIDRQFDAIPELKKLHPRTGTVVIEEAAAGKSVEAHCSKTMSGIELVSPQGSKEERAIEVIHIFKSGYVVLPADNARPWAADALEEIVSFGDRAKYKDRVDTLTQGIKYLEDNAIPNISLSSMTKKSGWNIT